jgi:hypothetical protein
MARFQQNGNKRRRLLPTKAIKPVTKAGVKQILQSRQEVKVNSSGITGGIAFTLAGTIIPLDTIGQGDNINQRSGDTVRINHLRVQTTAFEPTVNTSSTWRIIIFSDTMANGAPPAVTDVLDSASFTAPYNGVNFQRRRFKIYHDRTYVLVGGNPNQEVTDIFDSPMKVTRYYNDATATNSNIGKNALFALIISSNAVTSVYARNFQIRYTDS